MGGRGRIERKDEWYKTAHNLKPFIFGIQKNIFVCICKPSISFLTKAFLELALKVDCILHTFPNQMQNQVTQSGGDN